MESEKCYKKNIEEIEKISNKLKAKVLKMTTKAGSGHPGGSMSSSEIIASIYFNILKHHPDNPKWEGRDIFILSKGHCAPILYAALSECGYFDDSELDTLRCKGSILQGHPDCKKTPGIEVSTGSLGTGLSIGCGAAASMKLGKTSGNVYVLLGDGECNEGQVWEAAMFASHYKLENLIAIIDLNRYQVDGKTSDIMDTEPLDKKFKSFGWEVKIIDGHSIKDIIYTLKMAKKRLNNKPKMIIAKTVKGKGVSFMENNNEYHGSVLNLHELERALLELGSEGENI